MLFQLTLTVILLPSLAYSATYNATVAKDGSGGFTTVQAAINQAPGTSRYTIFIKSGTYQEVITVTKRYVTLIGENDQQVVLKNNLYANMTGPDGNPIGTFKTATVFVNADDFEAQNVSFLNDAGQNAGQALAIRVDGSRAKFSNCRFLGWQDTILVNQGTQYFQNCFIQGHVDFIFGAATAFFDKCHIYSLSNGFITAASTPQNVKYGLVFSQCTVDGASGVQTYLGRPWRPYASVYFVSSSLSNVIRPAGWSIWQGTDNDKTARYYEYGNTGAGASLSQRVNFSHTITQAEAQQLTPVNVLGFSP